jgi:hypothetical protein
LGELLVIVACVGEYLAEFKEIPRDENKRKLFEKRCVKILIAGLSIGLLGLFKTTQLSNLEVAQLNKDAADARQKTAELEKQIADTKANLLNINPLNQLVSDVSLIASIELRGTNFIESPLWGSPAVARAELCDSRTNVGPIRTYSSLPFYSTLGEFAHLQAMDFNRVNFGSGHGYILRFQPDALLLGSGFRVSFPPKVSDVISNLPVVTIDLKFIPNDSEVTGGSAYLLINGGTRMRFDILPQKAYPPPIGLGNRPGDSGFTLIATNGMVAPTPRSWR